MADQPKKHVGFNITSDPDITSIEQPGAEPSRERSELPLRLMLVSDLAPGRGDVAWDEGTHVQRVDANTFAGLLEDLSPQLSMEVENKVSSTPRIMDVSLTFASMDDFHPRRVAEQVPALAQLLGIRTLVHSVKDGSIDLDAFKARLDETGVDENWASQLYEALSVSPSEDTTGRRPAEANPTAAPSGDEGDQALDRILGMVGVDRAPDEAQETRQPVRSEGDGETSDVLGALIGAVAGEATSKPKIEQSAADLLLSDIDGILSDQLNVIFQAPAFQKLESAWRGLKFLVDRLPLRRNVHLEVLPVGREDLSEALYHQVLMPEHESEGERPSLSAVIIDFEFDNSQDDIDQLEDLAETGASLQVSIIASASSQFFGVARPAGLSKLPPLLQLFGQPEYIAWNKLRERKEARHLALAIPPFALRYAYGKDAPVKAFTFTEEEGCWGGGALAVAVAMANSFVDTGWPTHLLGERHGIEDLPIRKVASSHVPLAALVPDSKLAEFAKAGFIVLGGKANKDTLYVARAQTVCKPEAYEDLMAATEARIHVTLACQLFVSRAAHFLLALQQDFEPVEDPMSIVEARLRAFLHTEGHTLPREAVEVERVSEMDLPDHELLAVRLRTPPYILDRAVSLVMGVQVPKAPAA